MKKCTRCLEDKPLDHFYKDAKEKDGIARRCKECRNQEAKEYYQKNKERLRKTSKAWKKKNPDKVKKHRERERVRIYSITTEHYNDLLNQQNNCCAICRGENEDGRSLSVDHDHSCCKGRNSCGKCIRQLLCNGCNSGLGHFKDNPALLRQAAEYIENHRQ